MIRCACCNELREPIICARCARKDERFIISNCIQAGISNKFHRGMGAGEFLNWLVKTLHAGRYGSYYDYAEDEEEVLDAVAAEK